VFHSADCRDSLHDDRGFVISTTHDRCRHSHHSQSQPPLGGSMRVPPLALSLYLMSSQPPPTSTDWFADSDTSYHTAPDRSIFSLPHPHSPTFPSSIIVSNGSTLPVTSVGDTVLSIHFYLNNILVAPNMATSSKTFSQSIASPLITIVRWTSIRGGSPYSILPLMLWSLDATAPTPDI
jgi:hypothetical protein